MKQLDYDAVQRVVVMIGLAVVVGLWAAEEAGLIGVAPQNAVPLQGVSVLESKVPAPPRVILSGVMAAQGDKPPMAVLALPGNAPMAVPEGAPLNDEIRVERVLPDKVLLRWRDGNAPIVVPLLPPK